MRQFSEANATFLAPVHVRPSVCVVLAPNRSLKASKLVDGGLRASNDKTKGHRFLCGREGVYFLEAKDYLKDPTGDTPFTFLKQCESPVGKSDAVLENRVQKSHITVHPQTPNKSNQDAVSPLPTGQVTTSTVPQQLGLRSSGRCLRRSMSSSGCRRSGCYVAAAA